VADDCFIAPMPAEIDVGNAARVRADLLSAVNHSKVVIADLGRTSFCDCAGVSALLTAGSYAARTGAELLIVARSRAVLRTFELTGLPLRLAVYATCAEAQRGPPPTRQPGGQHPQLSPNWCRWIRPATRSAASSLSFRLPF